VAYLEHGFRKVLHLRLRDAAHHDMTVDLYDLGDNKNAVAALNDERICASGAGALELGVPNKTHLYPPEYLLYFAKGRYLVFLNARDDAAELVRRFARQLVSAIR
jgi:hypothetical protein